MLQQLRYQPTLIWPTEPAPACEPAQPAPKPLLDQHLASFEPISLPQMDSVALLNRTDSKYVCSMQQLAAILPDLAADYRVLEIAGRRMHRYHTRYFDSADFALYRRHHAGGRNRYKVRSRTYLDTQQHFLEVKHKINKYRTIKHRMPTPTGLETLNPASKAFVQRHVPFDVSVLQSTLTNDFGRITLVNIAAHERVTLDIGIQFQANLHTVELTGVVIAEVKQAGISRSSPFIQGIRGQHLHTIGMSKYCSGAALLYPELPRNSFKPTLRYLHSLMEYAQ
ncbi:polyphosphate polymerase domain-containing protein [Herpetosiphon sp. NSE202]|uniref:polyphosphate polymerase domain-containing protein n=1 Tax=Herpetosiphon sp. NSE202 TaxID=3351349 RepID=UPI00362BB37B